MYYLQEYLNSWILKRTPQRVKHVHTCTIHVGSPNLSDSKLKLTSTLWCNVPLDGQSGEIDINGTVLWDRLINRCGQCMR